MELRIEGSGILQHEVVYTRGVGPSSLNKEELEWTIRVLDAQVLQHVYWENRYMVTYILIFHCTD